jgi:hypothetical protein
MPVINPVGAPQIAQPIPAPATPALWKRVWNVFKTFLSSCWQLLTCRFCSSRRINAVQQPAVPLAVLPPAVAPIQINQPALQMSERIKNIIVDHTNRALAETSPIDGMPVCRAAVIVKLGHGERNPRIIHSQTGRFSENYLEEFRNNVNQALAEKLNAQNLVNAQISIITVVTKRVMRNDNHLFIYESEIPGGQVASEHSEGVGLEQLGEVMRPFIQGRGPRISLELNEYFTRP